MMRWLLAATIVASATLLPPAAVQAGGYADWSEFQLPPPPVPPWIVDPTVDWDLYQSQGHLYINLLAVVDPDDQWLNAGSDAYFEGEASGGYSFWDHPAGDALAPNPVMFNFFPLMVLDSFWTSPEEYPNTDLDPSSRSTAFSPGSPIENSAVRKTAEWYVDPAEPNVLGEQSIVERFNVMGLCPEGYSSVETPYGAAAELVIDGHYGFASGEDADPFQLRIPLCWYIPEPSALALLGFGGLLIRRR